ncbi:uncharacterized protein LOC108150010 isoform X2 [Drosophila elegans]|uniref:uncharacterized protein LOC108150010 isoform X2 n=1 Tax=Drosophila elegans TaxID=30023 RepID=UPI001BC850C2|nr:uncharacterized protein LOC108150010 isoform X2 [Drosophila elegans]
MALCFRNIKRHMCMLMRQNFAKSCENKLNDQINMELKACHQYLAMVSLPFRSFGYQFAGIAQVLPAVERGGAGARGEDYEVHEQAGWSYCFEQCTRAVALFCQQSRCPKAGPQNGAGGQSASAGFAYPGW